MASQTHRNSPDASTAPAEGLGFATEPINFTGRFSYDPIQSQSTLSDDIPPTFMYGSPDALSSLPASATSFAGGYSSITQQRLGQGPTGNRRAYPRLSGRPELASRSISSPLTPATRQRGGSTATRVPSGLKQSAQHHGHHPHTPSHEWSLFSQMMENEGQLPPSPQRLSRTTSASSSIPLGRSARPGLSHARGSALLDTQRLVEEVDLHGAFEGTGRPSSSETHVQAEFAANEYDSTYDSDSPTSERASGPGLSDTGGNGNVNEDDDHGLFSLENLPTLTVVQRNVLKCAIAYFIASLFTFSPQLSAFIGDLTSYGPGSGGHSPSAHMVATIAVYFNPAKTVGAMVEADLFCLMALVYSVFVCGASMSMFWWLELKPGWEWLGDAVAILWIGLSMSVVAWMKVWMASPSFNTACSMTAIIIFVVIVKEGGLETLMGVSTIVLCGSLVSNVVCYLIWPQTATHNLQINMTKTLDSFSTLLSMLTNGFLLKSDNFIEKTGLERVQKAVEDHQNSFTSLKKNLAEAKKEWMDTGEDGTSSGVLGMASLGQNRRKLAYEDAVASLTRLAQHLNGLRSGTRLQYELTRAGVHKGLKGKEVEINQQDIPEDEDVMLKAAAEMFGALVDEVGSPLKALTRACTRTLSQIREAFLQSRTRKRRTSRSSPDFAGLADGIERVLVRFESTSNHALLRLYRRSDISHPMSNSLASLDQHASHTSATEEINGLFTSNDHEHVFLVYFFIFTVQEFARELVALVDAMERIYECEQRRLHRRSWIVRAFGGLFDKSGIRWWNWKRRGSKEQSRGSNLKRRLSTYLIPEHRNVHPGFPKIRPHAPNTVQTPSRSDLPFSGRIKQSLWAIGARMQARDIKFALKAGMATAILAAPAFFDATRPFFIQYWGDWALISFFVVISPTIGATNYLSLQRVLGTLFGAAVAAGIYSAFPDDAIVLSIFGFFFSLPCFYVAVSRPQYLSASRFVLLTYNLTCLYCYNARHRDVSPVDVAFHRAVAVTAGVLWAAFISRFWWPSEARRELSRALGEFCLNIGWLYMRLVASNSYSPEPRSQSEANGDHEMVLLLGHEEDMKMKGSIHEFMAMELHLQIKLIELQGLLAQAQHEPRLKGPFPVQLYRRILTSLQTILDKLHSMRCVTTREEWHTSVRRDFIIPVNRERREMVGNIILGFATLASAFHLKAPLPPYLPPAEKARQRLVAAIRNLDVVKNREVKGSRQLLFFAYAMTMQGVTQELDTLGKICQDAFGVIGQTPEEFEALFLTSEPSQSRIGHIA